jgi:hypothetical protein
MQTRKQAGHHAMTRKQIVALIVIAGYHNDTATGTRLYVEGRISMATYHDAFTKGKTLRAQGMKCTCQECKNVAAFEVQMQQASGKLFL